jgi:hypothetical protein
MSPRATADMLCGPCPTGKSEANFTDSLISENQANRGGAGITVISGSHLTLENSNVTNNEAGGITSVAHKLFSETMPSRKYARFFASNLGDCWRILGQKTVVNN